MTTDNKGSIPADFRYIASPGYRYPPDALFLLSCNLVSFNQHLAQTGNPAWQVYQKSVAKKIII